MYGLLIVLPALFAWLGYREASKFARENGGRPPWGLHPGLWALFTGLSLLVGGVLLAIARRTTDPAGPGSMQAGPAGGPPSPYGYSAPLPQDPPVGGPVTGLAPPADLWATPVTPAAPAPAPPVPAAPAAPAAPVPAQPVSAATYQVARDILPGR